MIPVVLQQSRRIVFALASAGAVLAFAVPALAANYSVSQEQNSQSGNWRVCVNQSGGNNQVAGVEMVMSWDPGCMSSAAGSGKPKCESNRDTGKSVQSAMKGASSLKALFLSFSDVEPIPDGWLFCCDFRLSSSAPANGCRVTLSDMIGSTGTGQRVAVQASGGGGGAVAGSAPPPVRVDPGRDAMDPGYAAGQPAAGGGNYADTGTGAG
ncbi:MAG TPA: hypothetical protein VEB21_13045, partial [Terriglobales bacterium]|nr:hypothetical protein [Terriglobales bacterium]